MATSTELEHEHREKEELVLLSYLKHNLTGKVHLVMRLSNALKSPHFVWDEHSGNEKSCEWHATDFLFASIDILYHDPGSSKVAFSVQVFPPLEKPKVLEMVVYKYRAQPH